MYSAVQLFGKYLQYWLSASSGKGHGIHSPFVYSFIREVLQARTSSQVAIPIEHIRRKLLKDETILEVEDFGAGSVKGLSARRSVKKIASTSLKPPKYAQLLYRIAATYQPDVVLELGTCLGITTSYLAKAVPEAEIYTLEGSASIANYAETIFQEQGIKHVSVLKGAFEQTLPKLLSVLAKIDMVFMDGHHQYEPTIRYFEQILPKLHPASIVIVDDIHWSSGMEKAWNEIRQYPQVSLSIDLFFIGILFFRKEQYQSEHFVIRF